MRGDEGPLNSTYDFSLRIQSSIRFQFLIPRLFRERQLKVLLRSPFPLRGLIQFSARDIDLAPNRKGNLRNRLRRPRRVPVDAVISGRFQWHNRAKYVLSIA